MKQLLTFLFILSSVVCFSQAAPTSAKTKFVNGSFFGSKDTSAFSAADTMALTMGRDSILYYRYKGYWKQVAVGGDLTVYTTVARFLDSLTNVQSRIQTKQPLGNYLTFADSLSGGYTTWLLTKKKIDSLGAASAPSSGSTSYIQNGTFQQASSNFNISGVGKAATSFDADYFRLIGNDASTVGKWNGGSGLFHGYNIDISGGNYVHFGTGTLSGISNDNSQYFRVWANTSQSGGATATNRFQITPTLTTISTPLNVSGASSFTDTVRAARFVGSFQYNPSALNYPMPAGYTTRPFTMAGASGEVFGLDMVGTNNAGRINFRRFNSGALAQNTNLLQINAFGYNGTDSLTSLGAQISIRTGVTQGTWTSTSFPTRIEFQVVDSGQVNRRNVFTLEPNGAALINGASQDFISRLRVAGSMRATGLYVDGDAIQAASSYHNWGTTSGSSGYGFRDNAGTMEYKNSGGAWAAFGSGGITGTGTSGQVAYWNGTNTQTGSASLTYNGSTLLSLTNNAAASNQVVLSNNSASAGAYNQIALTTGTVTGYFGLSGVGNTAETGMYAPGNVYFNSGGTGSGFNIGNVDASGVVRFYTGGSASSNERGRILANGRLLWGTTTDNGALAQFNGTVTISGATTLSNLAGTGTRAVEASSTGVLSATKIIDAGTYTPTATAIQNTSSITPSVAQYMRVGNIVTVTGSVAFTQGTSTGATQIDLTLPIASTFTTTSQLAGTANDKEQSNQQSGVMQSLNTGTQARFYFSTSTTSSLTYTFYYTYTYQIL